MRGGHIALLVVIPVYDFYSPVVKRKHPVYDEGVAHRLSRCENTGHAHDYVLALLILLRQPFDSKASLVRSNRLSGLRDIPWLYVFLLSEIINDLRSEDILEI